MKKTIMTKYSFDAVIFDLDGVITKTALVHSIAWTRMFNDYLHYREEKYAEAFQEFTHENDYLPHVDGKPRYKGVADFLKSRNIDIPFGDPSDGEDKETACGLGNRKNKYFTEIIENEGIEVYPASEKLLIDLKKKGIRIGVASSSKNCKMVLEATNLLHYFETRVDGVVSAQLGLKGKPEPDIFTTACDNLGVAYDKSIVIEDAVSGVQAGAKGGFGLTLGVAREENSEELKRNGADIVVSDISELGDPIEFFEDWFKKKIEKLKWRLSYNSYEASKEKSRETLLSVGNGFFATRGSMEDSTSGDHTYHASYMTGLYNKRKSKVGDKWIVNEDIVNFIDWIPVTFKCEDEDWFDPENGNFELIERYLDLKNGVLHRKIEVTHSQNRKSLISSKRFVSIADPHLAVLEYSVSPLNYSGEIEFKSSLDGHIINDGVERYRDLDQQHLEPVDQGYADGIGYVVLRTNQSDITIAVTQKLALKSGNTTIKHSSYENPAGQLFTYFKVSVSEGQRLDLKKTVCIHNSKDFKIKTPLAEGLKQLSGISGNDDILKESEKVWADIWREVDIEVEGDRYSQMLLRLHVYHLILTASPFHKDLDAGIPARGLSGEAYRGHIFWDELYIMPFYISHLPETAKSVLMYRYRRLDKAREYAKEYGYEGAMFPWQSGSDGSEETQIVHLNPVSGEWGDDYSSLQRHISIAIAYNIWQYYQITDDKSFMDQYGAEMFFEICRFWASKSEFNAETDRYSIHKVMGPDEFHEKLPDSSEGGISDNAYTNLMVVWCIDKAFEIMDSLDLQERTRIVDKISLSKEELVKWKEMSLKMNLIINDDGIISQFKGYFELKELDWDAYRLKYENIHRLDRILKAEGKSPDDYKLAKQADTLMTFYNVDDDEIGKIIRNLGYQLPKDYLKRNFEYYLERTSHGSTLSRVVHAYVAKITGNDHLCWDMYLDALASDFNDIQGGTTGEGIHAGVMGGTVLSAITTFGGLNWNGVCLRLDPDLPKNWKSLKFRFHFKKLVYNFFITRDFVRIIFEGKEKQKASIFVRGIKYELVSAKKLEIKFS
jgi:beta-phosphoglucomutase family hydrolase